MRAETVLDFITLRPHELQQMDAAYSRLDAISGIIGVKPTRHVVGEKPYQYRRRLLAAVQPHSAKYKHINTATLAGGALDIMEEAIYQDAVDTAHDPMSVPRGQTRTIQYRDQAGRLITKTIGQEALWMDYFIAPGAIAVINRNPPTRQP